jgi:hypothetical protein
MSIRFNLEFLLMRRKASALVLPPILIMPVMFLACVTSAFRDKPRRTLKVSRTFTTIFRARTKILLGCSYMEIMSQCLSHKLILRLVCSFSL